MRLSLETAARLLGVAVRDLEGGADPQGHLTLEAVLRIKRARQRRERLADLLTREAQALGLYEEREP